MKSLLKIIVRFLLSAIAVAAAALFLNILVYGVIILTVVTPNADVRYNYGTIADELTCGEQGFSMSDSGQALLEQDYAWAMLLDESGDPVWDWRLPAHLNRHYTASDISRFSKWYLDDYPVWTWVTDYGLFVIACPQNSIWKQHLSESTDRVLALLRTFPLIFLANLILVFLFAVFLGFRFYLSLKGVASGIQNLSEQRPVRLREKGMTEILARQINRASDILTKQKEFLEKRDDARTAWISGVSHDVRTPLSLIMGYAGTLQEDSSLNDDQRRQAELIVAQSQQIKRLIEDLNLTSKLEYEMQPLNFAPFSPARLLRSLVSGFYNQELDSRYEIELYIDPEADRMVLEGDENLLTRAFGNLIQNSIRHNPQGCHVLVTAYPQDTGICFQISDDGCGIPQNVIRALAGTLPDSEKAPHIMGLRIAWQVFRAHGWQMSFADERTIHILTQGSAQK